MTRPRQQDLPPINCQHGAPMGRRSIYGDPEKKIVFAVKRLKWVDGDYDEGGVYWGFVAGTHIYRCSGECGESAEAQEWLRGESFEDIAKQLRAMYPSAVVKYERR